MKGVEHMLVFLSCTRDDDFFLNSAEKAKKKAVEKVGPHIELFHPPSIGIEGTGSVIGNVSRIMFADLILMDITPYKDDKGQLTYNPGVMIEFGMTFGQDLRSSESLGKYSSLSLEKPNYNVFSNSAISRSNLTPIFNNTDIISYSTNEIGEKELIEVMLKSIMNAVGKKLDRSPVTTNNQYNAFGML